MKYTFRHSILSNISKFIMNSCSSHEKVVELSAFFQKLLKLQESLYRLNYKHMLERLYCKGPIQCLASSKILTPTPLTPRRVCTPPPSFFGAGGGHTGWRGGWGVNILEDARHSAVLYIRKYFVC